MKNKPSVQVMKQPAKGTGRVAKGAAPLQLMRHQFKPGMAYMQKLAKGTARGR